MPKNQTSKRKFYDALHEDIARKVPLTVSQIELIRDVVLGRKMNRKEAAEWLALQLYFLRSQRRIENYIKALNFVASAKSEEWAIVTKKVVF